jgi:predicted NUDIX family phosphoesterase
MEKILVVESCYADGINGFSKECCDLIPKLIGNSFFTDREEAENNENLKQIIPYVLIKLDNKILLYKRLSGGGENRLHDKYSIGIGGHINKIDVTDLNDILMECVLREVNEELSGVKIVGINYLGIVNLNETPVDRVHTGIVIEANVELSSIFSNEPESIELCGFYTWEELKQMDVNFEGWASKIIKGEKND